MMLAHARAVLAFEECGHPGKIGVIHALEYKYPYDPRSAADIEAAANDDVLQNRLLLDATFRGDYAPDTLARIEALCAVSGGTFPRPRGRPRHHAARRPAQRLHGHQLLPEPLPQGL